MKLRYHLFTGHDYYPDRGLGDYTDSFETEEEAVEVGKQRITEYQWYSVIGHDDDGSLIEASHGSWRDDD